MTFQVLISKIEFILNKKKLFIGYFDSPYIGNWPGCWFIHAYIIQEKLNISYTGIEPQLEVHTKNFEVYDNYNNIHFINKKLIMMI